jgi:hypothetical protein
VLQAFADRPVSDGIPELQTGRVALERIGSRAQIVLSTPRAVNDPLLRLTLQAGCDNPVRREYVLMLDPAAIEAPIIAERGIRGTCGHCRAQCRRCRNARRIQMRASERNGLRDVGFHAHRVPVRPGRGWRGRCAANARRPC